MKRKQLLFGCNENKTRSLILFFHFKVVFIPEFEDIDSEDYENAMTASKVQESGLSITDLPPELLENIFSYLHPGYGDQKLVSLRFF
jgi:hypothetical protein